MSMIRSKSYGFNLMSSSFFFSMKISSFSFSMSACIYAGDFWMFDFALFLIFFTLSAKRSDCTLSSA
jgi:hypothetical protein